MFNIFKNNCCHVPKECDLVHQLQQTQADLDRLENSLNLQACIPHFDRFIGKQNIFTPCWDLRSIGDWLIETGYGRVNPITTLPSTSRYDGIPIIDNFDNDSGGQEMLRGLAKWLNELADIKDKYKETQEHIKKLRKQEIELKNKLGIN